MTLFTLRKRFQRSWLLPLVLAFSLAACDSGDTGGGDPPPEEEGNIVAGVDFDVLFAPPTSGTLQAIQAEWASRTYPAVDFTVEASQEGDAATIYVVSHTQQDQTGPFTHYGVVRVPNGASNLPVLNYHHGGDDGFSASETLASLAAFGPAADAAVIVFPVYRSEAITDALGQTYQAGGQPSPWDRDVDDSIALMNGVLTQFDDETDDGRIGAVGFSRGGAVAMLSTLRDNRIQAVSDFFGPTDFFTGSIQQLAQILLAGTDQQREFVFGVPGAEALYNGFLLPLAQGQVPIEQVRTQLALRSAAYFTADLPALQVHHGTADQVVPFDHFQSIQAKATASARTEPSEFISYEGIGHTTEGMDFGRFATFMQANLFAAQSRMALAY